MPLELWAQKWVEGVTLHNRRADIKTFRQCHPHLAPVGEPYLTVIDDDLTLRRVRNTPNGDWWQGASEPSPA